MPEERLFPEQRLSPKASWSVSLIAVLIAAIGAIPAYRMITKEHRQINALRVQLQTNAEKKFELIFGFTYDPAEPGKVRKRFDDLSDEVRNSPCGQPVQIAAVLYYSALEAASGMFKYHREISDEIPKELPHSTVCP